MKTIPLIRQVAAIIAERGPSTLDDIAPLFPSLPRKTVQKAMSNARSLSLLDTGVVDLIVGSMGGTMATYVATELSLEPQPPRNGYMSQKRPYKPVNDAPVRVRVSSVFQLGAV